MSNISMWTQSAALPRDDKNKSNMKDSADDMRDPSIANPPAAKKTTCSLLDLPTELREDIWRQCVTTPLVVNADRRTLRSLDTIKFRTRGLAQTNRQIRSEVLATFMRNTTFHIGSINPKRNIHALRQEMADWREIDGKVVDLIAFVQVSLLLPVLEVLGPESGKRRPGDNFLLKLSACLKAGELKISLKGPPPMDPASRFEPSDVYCVCQFKKFVERKNEAGIKEGEFMKSALEVCEMLCKERMGISKGCEGCGRPKVFPLEPEKVVKVVSLEPRKSRGRSVSGSSWLAGILGCFGWQW